MYYGKHNVTVIVVVVVDVGVVVIVVVVVDVGVVVVVVDVVVDFV